MSELTRARSKVAVAVLLVLSTGVLAVSSSRAATVVALGDSYSSGEGTAPYDSETDRGDLGHKCHRSAGAWGRLIGATRTTHVACSGAVIDNVTKRGQTRSGRDAVSQLKQLRAMRDAGAIDYATVTLGGNDLGFADKLKFCYLWGNVRGCLKDREALKRDLARLRPRVAGAYRDINMATRGGTTLVVGYPDIFPPPSRGDRCAWLTKSMKENIEWFSGRLDATLRAAAGDAKVSYLSIRETLAGHELCTGRAWVRALGGKPGDVTGDQQQGHPLKEGQAAIARTVLSWLRAHPRPGALLPVVPDLPPPGSSGSEQAGDNPPTSSEVPAGSYPETTGGPTNTWTNPANAGGTQGPTIPAHQTVGIACKLQGFQVANGNRWWYRIASAPWNGQYYASADAFYNNGQTSGSLLGTPWVDPSVPDCAAPLPASRQIVVDNRVTNGATQMREDTPAYLSTVMQNYCKRDGCALAGTDMGSGAVITAECTGLGARTTNGQDGNAIDDGNPGLYSSTRWYGIRWGDGRSGFISEVWIRADFRGGLGLRTC